MSSGAYAAASSSGEARSALVSSSSGSIRASKAATRMRSIMPDAGRRVGQRGDDDELVGVGDDRPLVRVVVVGGPAQHGVALEHLDDAGQRALLAGDVAVQPDPVADDHAHPAELAGLGRVDLPTLVGAGQDHPVATPVDGHDHADRVGGVVRPVLRAGTGPTGPVEAGVIVEADARAELTGGCGSRRRRPAGDRRRARPVVDLGVDLLLDARARRRLRSPSRRASAPTARRTSASSWRCRPRRRARRRATTRPSRAPAWAIRWSA